MAFQKTIIQGNIGKIDQLTYTNSGTAVLKMSVAVGEKYNGDDKTIWYPVKCFKGTAETISKYFSIGDTILLDGKMSFYTYEKEGRTIYGYEMIAMSFSFCGGKKQNQQQVPPQQNQGGFQNTQGTQQQAPPLQNQGGFQQNTQQQAPPQQQNNGNQNDNQGFQGPPSDDIPF